MIRQSSSVPPLLNSAKAQTGKAKILKIVSELGKFGRSILFI
jgi:hypothetical protein